MNINEVMDIVKVNSNQYINDLCERNGYKLCDNKRIISIYSENSCIFFLLKTKLDNNLIKMFLVEFLIINDAVPLTAQNRAELSFIKRHILNSTSLRGKAC